MLFFLCLIAVFTGTQSARILGIFPIPSISHQFVFDAYVNELVKHGNDVVFVTANPKHSKSDPVQNLTEIDISYVYNYFETTLSPSFTRAKRGVIRDVDSMFELGVYKGVVSLMVDIFKSPQLKTVIEDKNQHFDLIVVEAFLNYHLISSKLFNAPVILLSSFYGTAESFEIMGAVSRHPILFPNMFRSKFRELTAWDTIKECYNEYRIMRNLRELEDMENVLLKENFGPDAPTVQELKDNVAMLLLNSHPLFADNRPVPPGVVFLGSLHMKPVKDLPEDLKSYLDNSKRGVIYVSFGTNVRPELMDKDLLEAFLDAFEALPYDVLWKYNGNLERTPKNLKIQKWFPQRDLLTHPNIKVFITQGGMQSTDEAIDAGVPLIGIPTQGDQWFNTNKYIELGIGVQLDALTLTANDLISAVKTVVDDGSYRKNVKRLKIIINDQPQRPLERAVWWTEHVLRHGGTHLRSPGANISWTEYLMLDIFIPAFLTSFAIFTIGFLLMFYIIKAIIISVSTKTSKVKKN